MCEEHRVVLELVQRGHDAANMGTVACQGVVLELQQHWPSIMRHFEWEERDLRPKLPLHQQKRLLKEHADIRRAFANLDAAPATVRAFANMLYRHVMWEETEIMFFAETPGAVIESQTKPGALSASASRTLSMGLDDEHEDAFNIYNNFARPNPYGPVTPTAHLVRPLAGAEGALIAGSVAAIAPVVIGAAGLIFTATNAFAGRYGRAAAWFFGAPVAAMAVFMAAGGVAVSQAASAASAVKQPTFNAAATSPWNLVQ